MFASWYKNEITNVQSGHTFARYYWECFLKFKTEQSIINGNICQPPFLTVNNRKTNKYYRVKCMVQNIVWEAQSGLLFLNRNLVDLICHVLNTSSILTPLQGIHIMVSILKNVMLLQEKALTLVKNSGLLSKLEMSFSPLF